MARAPSRASHPPRSRRRPLGSYSSMSPTTICADGLVLLQRPADDDDPALMNEGAALEMAASIGQAGDRTPFPGSGIEALAGAQIILRDIMPHAPPPRA